MPKTEEGEFELVLGNKQLLSVFFIVVVLLGVFFAMGYIAGRNTAAGTKEVATSQPIIVESGSAAKTSPVETATREPVAKEPVAKEPVAKEPATREPERTASSTPPPHVAKEEPRAVAKEQPRAAAPPPKPAPEPPKSTAPVKAPPASAPAQSAEPAPGTYLQVAATTKAEGSLLLQVLTKRGFSAKMAQVPGQDMYRVVVGPVDGAQAIAKTRDDLKAAGFKPFTRKF